MTTLAAPTSLKRTIADTIRPQKRMPASAWAERNRFLKPGTTPQPGRWRNDYLPWLRPILDAFHDNPWAEGWAWMKPAQVAGSEVAITFLGHLFDYDPGPTLFLCTTIDQARKFSNERFEYMIASTPTLRSRFLRGKSNHETRLVKPAVGGSLIIAGSNSPNHMISNPCRYVFIDEEDRLPDFPGMGSAREIAEKRTSEYKTRCRCGIFGWAHPTTPNRGIANTYIEQTDQREWTIRCPECSEPFVPRWDHVEIHDRNPRTAIYRCPVCAKSLEDAQRWAANREGYFESQLVENERQHRRFVGFHLSRLCHPRTPLVDLAINYTACHSEAQLRVFWNMEMGEPYVEAAFVLTAEAIATKQDPRKVDRTAPDGTVFITMGVDVQKGPEQPTLYYDISAWTADGNKHLLEYGRVLGWAALDGLIRTFEAPVPGTDDKIRITGVGIDYGWKTREVYSFCRQDHAGIPCVPMKHTPGVQADTPARQKNTHDPLHPEYGGLARLELCRDYWMDRAIGRFSPEADPSVGGSVVLPANTSNEYVAHIKACRRVEVLDRHGHARLTWEREKNERDDWLQAGVNAEVVAVGLGLDRIHEAVPLRPRDQDVAIREGHVQRGHRYEGRSGGFIRGRRGRSGDRRHGRY